MLELATTTQYRKDLKRAARRGLNLRRLNAVLEQLVEQKPLAPQHKDHALLGEYKGSRECHIQPNWLLIYRVNNKELILTLLRTGTHDDLELE